MKNYNQTFNGIEQQLLQTLVPVNSLTDDHLEALLRHRSIETICAGQKLFSKGDMDKQTIYLLSGTIEFDSVSGKELVSAEDPLCIYPLSYHQPRFSSAIAESDINVIRFDTDQLDNMLAWDQASRYIMLDISSKRELDEDADWMITLLKSNLFYKVPPMNIRHILDKFEAQYMASGETILRQGEIGDSCYFIKEGLAGVYQAANDKSASKLVAELGVGRCFGEDALVNDAPRNATIIMHSNGVLMKLKKQDFFLLLKPPEIKKLTLAKALIDIENGAKWIDVRTEEEFEYGHSKGALNMPLDLLKLKSRMLDKNTNYIIYCNSGRRSEAAVKFLDEEGYNVSVLESGMGKDYIHDESLFNIASLKPM